MTRGTDFEPWKGIALAQRRIRDRVFRTGMPWKYHINIGLDMIADPGNLQRRFESPFVEGDRATSYLARLPQLVERTRAQDERRAKYWDSNDSREGYRDEHAKLAKLFEKFESYGTIHRVASH
jgi:hypothetical protein